MHTTSLNGKPSRKSPTNRERGTALVEFALVLIPLLAMVMLVLDVAWAIFAQATIQEAVREGVRVGVTATASGSCSSVTCTVQTTVQTYSFGFISPSQASSEVQVTFYSTTGGVLSPVTGSTADLGGNIIQVTVTGLKINSLMPLWRTQKFVTVGATASDVIESNSNPSPPT